MNWGFGRVTPEQIRERKKYKTMMAKFWNAEYKMVGNKHRNQDDA